MIKLTKKNLFQIISFLKSLIFCQKYFLYHKKKVMTFLIETSYMLRKNYSKY